MQHLADRHYLEKNTLDYSGKEYEKEGCLQV